MPLAAQSIAAAPDKHALVTAAEFAGLMHRLEPFAPDRKVVAAVSGGADSMALALLLRGWGDPLAVVVDHGLRPESAEEAALTLARLAGLGIAAQAVRLHLAPGPDLGARARAARYAALFQACEHTGRPDLLLGHHARDQDETVLLRRRAGSGPSGLAGMASLAWRGAARLLRPLLGIDPARLRHTLQAAGIAWVEDPGNANPATARGALRQSPIPRATPAGAARREAECELAAELARGVTLHPTGHAVVQDRLSEAAWSALIWTVSGRAYPPSPVAVRTVLARNGGTLHGVLLRGGLVVREAANLAPARPAQAGTLWDSRFRLRATVPGAELGALGDAAPALRRRPGWPAAVLRTLPALRLGGKLLMVPHLAYPDAETCRSVSIDFRPAHPLAGAPFGP